MQFECIEKHIFSGTSDYFRLFLTDALTPILNIDRCFERAFESSPIEDYVSAAWMAFISFVEKNTFTHVPDMHLVHIH